MTVDRPRQNPPDSDVHKLASTLQRMAGDAPGSAQQEPCERLPLSIELLAFAKYILTCRRRIDRFFDPQLFADPARDMLLDLFVAGEEGRLITVSSCCIGAAVPSTTALRWITTLADAGLIMELPDVRDRRRRLIRLSDHARNQMIRYLSSIDRRRPAY